MKINGVCIGGSYNGQSMEVADIHRDFTLKGEKYRVELFNSDWNEFYLFVEDSLTNEDATKMLLASYCNRTGIIVNSQEIAIMNDREKEIVKVVLLFKEVNDREGYIPDCFLRHDCLSIDDMRKIRNLVQEEQL